MFPNSGAMLIYDHRGLPSEKTSVVSRRLNGYPIPPNAVSKCRSSMNRAQSHQTYHETTAERGNPLLVLWGWSEASEPGTQSVLLTEGSECSAITIAVKRLAASGVTFDRIILGPTLAELRALCVDVLSVSVELDNRGIPLYTPLCMGFSEVMLVFGMVARRQPALMEGDDLECTTPCIRHRNFVNNLGTCSPLSSTRELFQNKEVDQPVYLMSRLMRVAALERAIRALCMSTRRYNRTKQVRKNQEGSLKVYDMSSRITRQQEKRSWGLTGPLPRVYK